MIGGRPPLEAFRSLVVCAASDEAASARHNRALSIVFIRLFPLCMGTTWIGSPLVRWRLSAQEAIGVHPNSNLDLCVTSGTFWRPIRKRNFRESIPLGC